MRRKNSIFRVLKVTKYHLFRANICPFLNTQPNLILQKIDYYHKSTTFLPTTIPNSRLTRNLFLTVIDILAFCLLEEKSN